MTARRTHLPGHSGLLLCSGRSARSQHRQHREDQDPAHSPILFARRGTCNSGPAISCCLIRPYPLQSKCAYNRCIDYGDFPNR